MKIIETLLCQKRAGFCVLEDILNENKSYLIDFQFTMQSIIILYILFTPIFTYTRVLYQCIDK
jgi:hypothetical protein